MAACLTISPALISSASMHIPTPRKEPLKHILVKGCTHIYV